MVTAIECPPDQVFSLDEIDRVFIIVCLINVINNYYFFPAGITPPQAGCVVRLPW